jgi:hypothetical protein
VPVTRDRWSRQAFFLKGHHMLRSSHAITRVPLVPTDCEDPRADAPLVPLIGDDLHEKQTQQHETVTAVYVMQRWLV